MQTDAIVIRAAVPADVTSILKFIHELAEFERLTHEVTATEAGLFAGLFGETPYAEAIVATVGGVTAGYALYFFSYSTFQAQPGLYLEDLYVSPDFRRRGIGRQLLIAVAQVAVERNCGRYEWSVLDWNAAAIELYEGLGAEMLHDWRRMRVTGSDILRLAKQSPGGHQR